MTSTPVSNLAQAQGPPVLLSKTGKLWVAIIGLLMVGFHYHFVRYTALLGTRDADWSHVLIIPLISIYYIYLHRQRLMATERRICRWGLPFIVAGVAGYVLGIYPLQNGMAQGYSMIMTLFGIVLLLLGPAMMRVLWFPICFLVFAVKISDAFWSVIASKMQGFAATGAVLLINLASPLTDMHATLRGSTIDLDYMFNNQAMLEPMNVAEACAGMRMLMAFLALGVALAFLFPRTWWQRAAMILLAAPIAIFVNALRVAVLGWLHLINKELAHGDFHVFVGMLMLIPAAGLLMLVGWCLDKMVIVEGKPERPPAPLPFDEDPGRVHIHTARLVKGAGLGAAVVVMLGLTYILLVNRMTGHAVIAWLGAGLNTALLALAGVLFLAGLGFAWHSIQRGDRTDRLALSQGVVGGLLLAAALGQTSAINVMGVALSKKPVPLRVPIELKFSDQAGDWQLVHQDPPLQKDVEAELGTEHYFNSYFANNAAGYSKDTIRVFTEKTPRGEALKSWDGVDDLGQFAKVHVAYYTGMLDTVPHVPDKCWIVAGQQMVYRAPHKLKLTREDYRPDPDHPGLVLAESTEYGRTVRLPGDEIEAIVFSAMDDKGSTTSALYFFLANGDAIASSHEVRFSFNLKDRYSYYCKVEVMFPGFTEQFKRENPSASSKQVADAIVEHAEDLLSDLLPEIMACLPDWTEVQAGTYPKDNTAD